MDDSLSELRDVHLPAAISAWPPAPGWWLVALLVLAACVLLTIAIKRRSAANHYRKAALTKLLQLNRDDTSAYIKQLNLLLKQTAIAAKPAQNIAALSGKPWLKFLDASLHGDSREFSSGIGEALETGPYQAQVSVDIAELEKLAQQWIARHSVKGLSNTGLSAGC